MDGSQKEFLHHLIHSGALKFGSFRFRSGRISPDYVSMRQAMSTGGGASMSAKALFGILPENVDYLHGPAYAGIPIAAIIASESALSGKNLRFGFDMKEETAPKPRVLINGPSAILNPTKTLLRANRLRGHTVNQSSQTGVAPRPGETLEADCGGLDSITAPTHHSGGAAVQARYKSGPVKPVRASCYGITTSAIKPTGSLWPGSQSGYAAVIDGAALNSFASGNLERAGAIDFIFGRPYCGIPFAAVLAKRLFESEGGNVRWGYARLEQKTYGAPSESAIVGDMREKDRTLLVSCDSLTPVNGIFGNPRKDDVVALVDDVLTSGGTKVENMKKLLKEGIRVSKMVVVVDREETSDEGGVPAAEWMESLGVDVFSVLKLTEVYDYLKDREINGRVLVTPEIYRSFEEYSEKYRSRK